MPAITAVPMPTHATMPSATGARLNSTWNRAMRYTPAVTMVAAWMSADTGVGPSIASGSQVCSGNCTLLANAPIASRTQIPVMSRPPSGNACVRAKMFGRLSVCVLSTMRNAAITSATSPITWVMNALRAASTADGRSCQNPMSR